MKKILFVVSLLILPLNVFSISASSMVVMDTDNLRVLSGYNQNDSRLIASITKIMTAIVAIENANIEDTVKVTDKVKESFGSGIYIKVGEEIKLKDLLYGLMLRSGNDAALMIAEYVGGGVDNFVYMMNEYANNLKMTNTVFINPHGLEDKFGNGNKSSSYDMALLTSYAIKNPTFRSIFKTKKYKCETSMMTYVWHNKNKLLKYDFVTGGKTGFTKKARRTLVTTGSKNNINVVVVTLNDPDDFSDHITLYKKVFSEYKSFNILDKDRFKIKKEKYYKKYKLYIKNDYNMTLKKSERKDVLIKIELIKYKHFNNEDIVGYANIYLKDNLYHKEPIYIKKYVDKFKGRK